MKLYDLYCPNCRLAYHYDLWKPCTCEVGGGRCRYCGWCDGDPLEEGCNVDFRSKPQMKGSE